MKKVYLLVLILFPLQLLYAQTSYRLNSSVELKNEANGNNNNIVWSNPGAWSPEAPLISGTSSGSITVPSGVTLTLSAPFSFNGVITVEDGGSVIFNRDNPNDGQLTMDAGSTIVLEEGASISSTGPASDQHNYLQIGDGVLYGDDINALPAPPFQLDEGYAVCVESGSTTCEPTPQPVTLLYFTAKPQSNAVAINWASSKAWDFSHYELERSANGKDFSKIADIAASENSDVTETYAYTDHQPLSGTSYYRLKAVDIDGSFEYKGIELVKFGAESFKVYPNPSTQGYIQVAWSHAAEGTTISLKDNTGRTVRTARMKGNTELSTEGLAAGLYVLSLEGPAGRKQSQVMIR